MVGMSESDESLRRMMRESVDHINEYANSNHHGNVVCSISDDKGRVLSSNRGFKRGDIIVVEPALHIVSESTENPKFEKLKEIENDGLTFDALWYWCALNSLVDHIDGIPNYVTHEQQKRLLMLFAPVGTEDVSSDISLVVESLGLQNLDQQLLHSLLQIWIHNCFEFADDPVGYAVFFMPAFLSHSCCPNVVWHYDQDANFVLRARVDIQAGEELTVSYLSEEALFHPTPARQLTLSSTKNFVCSCVRCSAELDISRGFRCPSCKQGVVYLSPDAGTEREDEHKSPRGAAVRPLLMGCPPPSLEWLAAGNEALLSGPHSRCQSCGYDLSPDDRYIMLKQEGALEARLVQLEEGKAVVAAWDAAPPPVGPKPSRKGRAMGRTPTSETNASAISDFFSSNLRSIDQAVRSVFLRNHWLFARWLAFVICEEQTRSPELAANLMLERLGALKQMYPCENGLLAWSLDEFADALLHKGTPDALKQALYVMKVCEDMLSLVFSPTHEYLHDVHIKLRETETRVAAIPLVRSPHSPSAGPAPSPASLGASGRVPFVQATHIRPRHSAAV